MYIQFWFIVIINYTIIIYYYNLLSQYHILECNKLILFKTNTTPKFGNIKYIRLGSVHIKNFSIKHIFEIRMLKRWKLLCCKF